MPLATRVQEGQRFQEKGDFQAARRIFADVLHEVERQTNNPSAIAAAEDNLASVEADLGRYAEAEALFQRAIGVLQKAGGPDNPESAQVIYHLAGLYIESGRAPAAAPLLKRYRRIIELESASSPVVYAEELANIGRMYIVSQSPALALPCLEKAGAILKEHLGANNERVMITLTATAVVLSTLGRDLEAVADIEQANAIHGTLTNVPARSSIDLLVTTGMVYAAARRPTESDLSFQKAAQLAESSFGPTHPVLGLVLKANATALQKSGRKRDAKPLDQRSNAILAQNGLQAPLTVDISTLLPTSGPHH